MKMRWRAHGSLRSEGTSGRAEGAGLREEYGGEQIVIPMVEWAWKVV